MWIEFLNIVEINNKIQCRVKTKKVKDCASHTRVSQGFFLTQGFNLQFGYCFGSRATFFFF